MNRDLIKSAFVAEKRLAAAGEGVSGMTRIIRAAAGASERMIRFQVRLD